MNYSSAYSVKFDAGHRYTVRVEWTREGFPAGVDQDKWDLAASFIDDLAHELRNRDLAKMLGPHHPSVWGIAAFFMERLAINVPVTRIEVHESDGPVAIIEHRN